MSNAKKLKCASIKELEQKAKIVFAGKEPRSVYQRLPAMRDMFEQAKNEGDDESAFIMMKRWLDSVEWLRRTRNKDGKSAYATSIPIDKTNEAKNILADLKQRLEVCYDLSSKKQNNTVEPMEIETNESEVLSSDIGLKLPEIPTEDINFCNDNNEFILCDQVYNLIQKKGCRYLIIDIRQKVHYESSRILSDRCINIPQSEIKPGLLASHFDKCFEKDERLLDLFRSRAVRYIDDLVLLDWNSTQESLSTQPGIIHINLLKNTFEKWDPGIKHPKIKILSGGYQEWLERYPAFTTNPNIEVPEFNNVVIEILETFEYPNIAESDEEEEFLKEERIRKSKLNNMRGSKKDIDMEMDHGDNQSATSVNVKKTNSNDVTSSKSKNFVTHTLISVDDKRPSRGDSVNGQRLENSHNPVSAAQPKILSNKERQNEVSTKPMIDRSNKPTIVKTYDPRCKEILRFMKELNELAKSKKKLAHELLNQEYELYSQREDKYNASDEKYLRTEIKSLKVKLEDMHKMYLKIEDEFNTYSKEAEAIKFNPTDDNEKKNHEFTLSMLKNEIKDIETKRKKLHEEFMQREHKETMKQTDSDVHKEPLKDSSSINTGLERSYSSPNLLQLGDRKTPQIDRTSKPHISPRKQNGLAIGNENIKVSSLSWGNREERMTPIHGTVHPGITGLKNLGNSCYMNSIIQCLSNTTNLAKYFTDNSYADDLNTSNDNMTQGQVVEEVAQVIKALWRGQYKSISPYDLKVAVGQYKLQFESSDQQDSHEFLTFLLDWMHNDLKKEAKMPIEMSNAEKEWDKAMNSQRSIISDLFFGQLKSTITCPFCKQASTTYETFNSLSMSLPQSSRCSLNDCMEKYMTGQKVSGWKCPKCQTPRDATKKFDFVKLAPIIVIHLNRFAETNGWFEKRNIAVDFPLTGFNLKPYLVLENTKAIMSNNSRNYSLYAISNHYGTMDGGHYTAFCKNAIQNKWYKYDDQTVTEVSSTHVKSQNTSAYLLFYTSFPNTIM